MRLLFRCDVDITGFRLGCDAGGCIACLHVDFEWGQAYIKLILRLFIEVVESCSSKDDDELVQLGIVVAVASKAILLKSSLFLYLRR